MPIFLSILTNEYMDFEVDHHIATEMDSPTKSQALRDFQEKLRQLHGKRAYVLCHAIEMDLLFFRDVDLTYNCHDIVVPKEDFIAVLDEYIAQQNRVISDL